MNRAIDVQEALDSRLEDVPFEDTLEALDPPPDDAVLDAALAGNTFAPPSWMDEESPDSAYADGLPTNDAPITTEDFFAYMPMHSYIFRPTRELWSGTSINSRIPPITVSADRKIKANVWLDQFRPVEQMTWAPGFAEVIHDRLVDNGGWIERPGVSVYNQYRPPLKLQGDPQEAGLWLTHVRRVFPAEAEHIIHWLAHRVQKPGEKINHAIVLGGAQGVGKDTIIDGVKHAIGTWNLVEVSPTQLMGRFNGFLKAVILRVSEARDQGDAGGGKIDRYGVYEHCKTITAAPPDVLRVDEKNLREHAIMNVCGVIFTTNHIDGLYLPADDRRHFVAWSEHVKEDFAPYYWRDLYAWYEAGGYGHVAAYLRTVDLAAFDPKAPPPKTPGWHRMVDAGRAPEDAEIADVLDALKNPATVTVGDLCTYASDTFRQWLQDRRNSRQIPHRMESAGYTAVRNDADKRDGQWKVGGRRQTVYARRDLSIRDRLVAVTALCRER